MQRDALALQADTVDVADLGRTLRRQWRAILAFVALGVLAAIAVILFAPKRYEGRASVLARGGGSGGASVLGRMTGGIGELMGGVGGLGGASTLETELQVLKSRALAAEVVDSLGLQVRVREPAGTPPRNVVASYALEDAFEPRKYEFVRNATGYTVQGDSVERTARPGSDVQLAVGKLTLASNLPERFVVTLYDEEDAITRLSNRLTTTKAGGEVARLVYRGDDRQTAAAVPNALIHFYLERRKGVDRGANQRRVEYVTEQVEKTSAELAKAESELRREQERTGVFDADISDVAQQEATSELRASLIQLQVDEAALRSLLDQAERGQLSSRDLAAYPVFMKGSAVSPMVTQLSELEIQKTRLLERRTERDPEVATIDSSMKRLNESITAMARSYYTGISRQRAEFQRRLDSTERRLGALPSANEKVGRLRRDVLRLTQLFTALQAQLVEARLAAIGEGGEVRQVDVAAVPRRAAFPAPFLTLGIGTAGGLMMGIIAALLLGWFGRWLRDPQEIERLTGIAAQRFEANAPLLVAGDSSPRTVLVVPLEARARSAPVAERLARTATARALPVSVLDFSTTGGNGAGAGHAVDFDIARKIDQLEDGQSVLVVQLPELSNDATIAAMRESRPVVLVAPPGPVDRQRLTYALDTLRRMQVPCAGIVISEANGRRLKALT